MGLPLQEHDPAEHLVYEVRKGMAERTCIRCGLSASCAAAVPPLSGSSATIPSLNMAAIVVYTKLGKRPVRTQKALRHTVLPLLSFQSTFHGSACQKWLTRQALEGCTSDTRNLFMLM